jgi:PHD/YefM family antitoxin component YafN of YafNO toxin-antitoxin module
MSPHEERREKPADEQVHSKRFLIAALRRKDPEAVITDKDQLDRMAAASPRRSK